MSGSFWDDEAGLDIRDPKHPDHYDSFTEYADMLNKRAKEDELVFACEDPESAWIQQLRDELGGEAA